MTHLQGVLLRQRVEFLREPMAADAHQGIAAFSSLHTSIIFTAAVAAHMLGLGRRLRIALWALFALTTIATVYWGWHYVADDLAGVVIGLTALALARAPDRLRAPHARCGCGSGCGPPARPCPPLPRPCTTFPPRARSRRPSRRPRAGATPA